MLLFPEKREKNNRELVERIILEKYNQYYRLACGYARNREDACDIVQNGAYKALRSCASLEKPEYVETWVYRIMLNECFTHLRRPQAFSYEEMTEDGVEAASTEDCYADVDLRRALDALPDSDRAVVILKYFEDRKLEEIADLLGENVNTVKSRLYRSLKKLRDILTDGKGVDCRKAGTGR